MATQQFSASRKPTVDADGVITYIDSNGDMVQMANSDIFNGLRLAGGEAFLPSSDDESSEDERQQVAMPMYAYAPSASTSSSKKSKKDKKEKKEKKSKKSRSSPEYIAAPAMMQGGASSHNCCSCGHHRH